MDTAPRSRGTFKRVGEQARPVRASKLSAFHVRRVRARRRSGSTHGGDLRPGRRAPAARRVPAHVHRRHVPGQRVPLPLRGARRGASPRSPGWSGRRTSSGTTCRRSCTSTATSTPTSRRSSTRTSSCSARNGRPARASMNFKARGVDGKMMRTRHLVLVAVLAAAGSSPPRLPRARFRSCPLPPPAAPRGAPNGMVELDSNGDGTRRLPRLLRRQGEGRPGGAGLQPRRQDGHLLLLQGRGPADGWRSTPRATARSTSGSTSWTASTCSATSATRPAAGSPTSCGSSARTDARCLSTSSGSIRSKKRCRRARAPPRS